VTLENETVNALKKRSHEITAIGENTLNITKKKYKRR
jgi:hypothetical protein